MAQIIHVRREDGTLDATLRLTPGGKVIKRLPDNPRVHTVRQNTKKLDVNAVLVSYLRAAFLAVFSLLGRFGYEYVDSPALRVVREQILKPNADIIKRFTLNAPDLSKDTIGIFPDPPHWLVKGSENEPAIILPASLLDEQFYSRFPACLENETVDGVRFPIMRFGAWPMKMCFGSTRTVTPLTACGESR